jgi:hypothetical protein
LSESLPDISHRRWSAPWRGRSNRSTATQHSP